MNYDSFKNKIIELFLNDKEIIYEKEYSKEEKQEFIDNHKFDYHESYEDECKAYDKGDKTVFQINNLKAYLFNLAFECFLYHTAKNQSAKDIVEELYPMTLNEFTEKVTDELIKECHNIYGDDRETTLKDLNKALEDDPTIISAQYRSYCNDYDKSQGRDDVPENYPFNNLSNAVYHIRMWLYF